MKNFHLVPQVIIDFAAKLNEKNPDHVRDRYLQILETVRDYCDDILTRNKNKK